MFRKLVGIAVAAASFSAMAISPENLAVIKENAKVQTDRLDQVGISISLYSEGEDISFAAGKKDLYMGEPLSPNHYMGMGSVTKTFVGILLGRYASEGKVKLDDPIDKYLPELEGKLTAKITLKELATHSSGLPRRPDGWWSTENMLAPFENYTEFKMIDFLSNYQLEDEDRGKYAYSNLGVGALGVILARVNQSNFEQTLNEDVLAPMGLEEKIFFKTEPDFRDIFSSKYNAALEAQPLWWTLGALDAAGVLKARPQDLIEYSKFIIDPGLAPELKEGIELSLKTHFSNGYNDLGLGWLKGVVGEDEWVAHDGSTAGFGTSLFILPKKKESIAIMTNTDTSPKCMLTPFLGYPCELKSTSLQAETVTKLKGHYSMDWPKIGTMVVHVFQGMIEGKLLAQIDEQNPVRVLPETEGRLSVAEGRAFINIHIDENGGHNLEFEQEVDGEVVKVAMTKLR